MNPNQGIIRKICRIYCPHDADDREDLFQEILLQLWKSFESFEKRSRFSTWLYRVALNTAIAGLKKNNRKPSTIPLENMEYNISTSAVTSLEEERLQKMYSAIGQLSDVEKALVTLYLEEKSYAEIEEILGINTNNLRVKMNRLKEKLKKLMKNVP